MQEICPLAEEWELMRELSYLDVDVDVLWRPFETLSNGEDVYKRQNSFRFNRVRSQKCRFVFVYFDVLRLFLNEFERFGELGWCSRTQGLSFISV